MKDQTSVVLPIPCIKKTMCRTIRILILSIFFYISQGIGMSTASEPEWSENELRWLRELSGPDYREGDFGHEPVEDDRELLHRFRPRIIISPHGMLPVDFYEFYLPGTVVRDAERNGDMLEEKPSRTFLKGIERDKRYYLDYTGPVAPCTECSNYIATGYGRIFREEASFRLKNGTRRSMPIIILKYNFVFPFSGLPKKIGFLREALARLVADPVQWHELDIHGAVHLILNETETPLVLLLAQHNHFRSYLISRDVRRPADDRVPVCFAERSNEPYPCPAGEVPVFFRAVGNPKHMPYVVDGTDKPFAAGEDKVYGTAAGGKEIDYTLKYLPDKDPLYVSWINLGDQGRIFMSKNFYRQGPPGIDFNTWPALKKYGDIMQFWYIRDNNPDDADLLRRSIRSFLDVDFEPVLHQNGSRLYLDLKEQRYLGPDE